MGVWFLATSLGNKIAGYLGGRVAAVVPGDDPVAAGEEADLALPTPVVAGELVAEDQREALAGLLIVELDAVDARRRHGAPPE